MLDAATQCVETREKMETNMPGQTVALPAGPAPHETSEKRGSSVSHKNSPSEQPTAVDSPTRALSPIMLEGCSRIPSMSLEAGIDAAVASWEPEPESALRRPFWLLRRLRTTISTGGCLTPRFYVPKAVWHQDGAKFTGLSTKVAAFEAVLALLIDRVTPIDRLDTASDLRTAKRVLSVFSAVRAELDQVQNNLARPFPFIHEVTEGKGLPKSKGGAMRLVSAIGKTMVKSATTAYERIGAAVPGRISDTELGSYAALVYEMCDKCQVLDEWYVSLDVLRKELQGHVPRVESDVDGEAGIYAVVEEILAQMMHIARFLHEVVCEVLLREVELLVDRYVKKMRKCFSRMQWDEEAAQDA